MVAQQFDSKFPVLWVPEGPCGCSLCWADKRATSQCLCPTTNRPLLSVCTFMQREAKHSQSQRSLAQLQFLKAKQTFHSGLFCRYKSRIYVNNFDGWVANIKLPFLHKCANREDFTPAVCTLSNQAGALFWKERSDFLSLLFCTTQTVL